MFKKTQIKKFEKDLIQYGIKHNYIEKEKDGTLKFVGSKNQNKWCVFVFFKDGVGGESYYFKSYKDARLYANNLEKGSYQIELEGNKNGKCNNCEGKGYYNLSANYDDIDSRIECEDCRGFGNEENRNE